MGGAIGLRIVLTFFAVGLLSLPYLKLVGALLLLWIGIKLILPEEDHGADNIKADTRLFGAVKTIIIADFVMSLDNVLGVAAAAKGNVWLLVFGLLVSIPMIAWSSQTGAETDRSVSVHHLRGRRAAWLCGGRDAGKRGVCSRRLSEAHHYLHWLIPVSCALLVLALGRWLAMRKAVSRQWSIWWMRRWVHRTTNHEGGEDEDTDSGGWLGQCATCG